MVARAAGAVAGLQTKREGTKEKEEGKRTVINVCVSEITHSNNNSNSNNELELTMKQGRKNKVNEKIKHLTAVPFPEMT